MSSIESAKVPSFETLEDELNYWKESYHRSNKDHQALRDRVALCQNCSFKEEEKEEDPPAKRRRIDEEELGMKKVPEADDLMDPFEKLKDDELIEILKYLSGQELLQAMEVSQRWKKFIEAQSILMNRAMDEVVVKPNLKDCSLTLAESLMCIDREKRPYKHMKSTVIIAKCFKFFKCYEPVKIFASSLKTLEIPKSDGNDLNPKFRPGYCEFPKLRMLKCFDPSFDFESFSFPEVTYLELGDKRDASEVSKILRSFPKLEVLNYASQLDYTTFKDPINKAIVDDPNRPKIKQIITIRYHGIFLKSLQASLQVLEIDFSNFENLSWIVRDLKMLKSLTIGRFQITADENDIEFQENRSIEFFMLFTTSADYSSLHRLFDDDDAQRAHTCQILQRFLQAVPSLKELVLLAEMNDSWITFIASNMSNLKRLVCIGITEETSQAHQEVRRNAYRYKNATFEVAKRTFSLNDMIYLIKLFRT